jgi:hypothetical protein
VDELNKLDREEFIQYWNQQDKFVRGWRLILFIFLYLGGIILSAIIGKYFDSDKNFVVLTIWFFCFFCFLLLFPFLWQRIFSGKPNKRFMKCPNCNRSARQTYNRMIIIATGKCGYCGEEVFTKSLNK